MPRVTNHGPSRPILGAGALGYDPDVLVGDAPDPVDYADDAAWTFPAHVTADLNLVQPKAATASGSSISAVFDATPTVGNLLVAVFTERSGSGTVSLSGWTAYPDTSGVEYTGFAAGKMWLFYKVAGASESATVTVTATASHDLRLMIAEFSGATTFDSGVSASDVSASTSLTTSNLTPTASVAVNFVGAFLQSATSMTIGGSFTEISKGLVGGSLTPYTMMAYREVDPTSGSYAMTATSDNAGPYGYILVAFRTTAGGAYYFPAFAPNDGDNATYDVVTSEAITDTSGVIIRTTLTTDVVLDTATLRIGMENAGSATIKLQGATVSDYSDAVDLASVTFTATGSYTADTLTFDLPATDGYKYLQFVLTTTAQDVRVYEVTLSAPPTESVAVAHVADTSDAHDASAISVADAGGYFTGTDVEAALQELGDATGSTPTNIWRPVMDGSGNVVTDSGTGEAVMAYGPL